jgi:Kef-type K+ transport system membrane component KefB
MFLSLQSLSQFKELLLQYPVFSVALLLISGYFIGRLFERLKLPAITGYIIAGLILSKALSGIITKEITHSLHILTDISLGIIALTIGGEFSFEKVKRTGIKIIVITLFEALFAFLFVTFFLTLSGFGLYYALLLGAIASATAPAATVIIVRELRARGVFIDYLYGVVAFDDAICVILFSIVFAIVTPLIIAVGATGEAFTGIINAIGEILLSAILGFVAGFILNLSTRKKYRVNEILLISLSVLFFVISFSFIFKLSLLIANMLMGATLINISLKNRRIFHVLEPLTPPLFALFFILAGTELDITAFKSWLTVLFGFIYLASRFSGKFVGVYIASQLTHAPAGVKKYLGFCLFPQAGVAIGLALFIKTSPVLMQSTPSTLRMFTTIINIILFSVLINEIIGPIISRYGIIRGVDIERR